MTEIYLIRHTQAEGNRYRMMQGFWDGDVTEKGKLQIEALAKRFQHLRLDAVYSSDLSRAVMTAEAAARWRGLPIRTRRALREINIGPWERCFFGNLCHETPELANRFMYDAENWQLDGAERFIDVRRRAVRELKQIAKENEGKTVAVCSHGVTIRCIMWELTGIPLADTERLPIFRNTAVSKLNWDGETFRIEYMNDVSHLTPDQQSSWNTTGDLWDEPFDPGTDKAWYEDCYADAWRASHGNLNGYNAETYYEAARRHHARNERAVLRIGHGADTVGLVDLDPERGAGEGVGWVSLLYLKEAYRNQGYGIQVLARPMFFYLSLGRRRLRLQVAEENGIARSFYRREGFREIGRQKTGSGGLLLMERPLKE